VPHLLRRGTAAFAVGAIRIVAVVLVLVDLQRERAEVVVAQRLTGSPPDEGEQPVA
jgi:hypothetical protein